MTEPLRIVAGERSTETILELLEDGHRIVVTLETLGSEHEVTLRVDGGIYYCDTPTRLHRHESVDEMRTCIRNMGYASDGGADESPTSNS